MIMTRINSKYYTASNLSCAYHKVPLSEEIQKLTSFIVGGRQYTYHVGLDSMAFVDSLNGSAE